MVDELYIGNNARTAPDSRLCASLAKIGQSNRHADCRFIIGSSLFDMRRFPCHKLIFSCASKVFDRMLFGCAEVRLHDVDPDIFEKFRDYLYGYEYHKVQSYDFKTLIQLCEFGNKYLVKAIEEDCVRELMNRRSNCSPGELLQLFQCAHRLNKPLMIETVGDTLTCNFSKRLINTDVYELNADAFKFYVKVTAGKLPETDRFHMVEMYLKHIGIHCPNEAEPVEDSTDKDSNSDEEQTKEEFSSTNVYAPAPTILTKDEENQKYIAELIGMIKFNSFTPKEFHDGPGQSNILTLGQKYEYMYRIAHNYATKRLSPSPECYIHALTEFGPAYI